MIKIIDSTYEVIKELGSGGGGKVYLANNKRLKKKVVLKVDKRKPSTKEDLLRREVDVLKNLSNAYIPQVYDYFIEDGSSCTAMEYIEGESLDKPLKRGERFKQATIIKWAIQLLSALEYLHSPIHGKPPRGYVHSDIKPANVMLKPNGDISLIDFNIALALGEEYAVGGSEGYASPEHYGLDYSTSGSFSSESDVTVTDITEVSLTETEENTPSHRRIMPDVRSDIYSVGATLYHLLSGKRPAKNALDVVPLSSNEFSPELVSIIMKALNPNPDLRFQSAAEMLYVIKHIRENDSRYKNLRLQIFVSRITLILLIVIGSISGFIGLRRMQIKSEWQNLTNLAETQFEQGDIKEALLTILKVYPQKKNYIYPNSFPHSQEVLTKILGVYDQKDGFYVKSTFQLPSEPLSVEISPDGLRALCTYDGNLALVDLETAEIIATLPMEKSAMSDAKFLDENVIIYAGSKGITAYQISDGRELWTGEKATSISISSDRSTVAAVYKNNDYALIYDTDTGREIYKAEFRGRQQKNEINDTFINTHDNMFELNSDGTKLAVSFSDGSLSVLNLNTKSGDEDIEIFSDLSGYEHYEGGFYQNYLAVAASTPKEKESIFIIINIDTVTQTGGFQSEEFYTTKADQDGIVVGVDNVLVRIDPETGDQTPLIDTARYVNAFSYDSHFAAISEDGNILVFDDQTNIVGELTRDVQANYLAVNNDRMLIGSSDSPVIWIAEYQRHYESALADYDKSYSHDEARLSGDGKSIVLFTYDSFAIFDLEGNNLKDVSIPNAREVYDQQFIREGDKSYLEVTYYNGDITKYDAANGDIIEQTRGPIPDTKLDEVFETTQLRIESPLHGTPIVYDKKTGEQINSLEDDGYLTYVTEVDGYIVAQYVTTDSRYYGYLMDQKCNRLAYLPGVCDVLPDGLLFDYHSGYIRKTQIYDLNTLLDLANQKLEEDRNP